MTSSAADVASPQAYTELIGHQLMQAIRSEQRINDYLGGTT